MKALTLTQPWATLVAIGAKRIETRSWSTEYRGPLAIHAAKAFPAHAKDLCDGSAVFRRALGWPDPPDPLTQEWLDLMGRNIKALPLGGVVATARLKCVLSIPLEPVAVSAQERAFGDYTPGRFAWILENVRPLPEPIPAKGALGLWEWNETQPERRD